MFWFIVFVVCSGLYIFFSIAKKKQWEWTKPKPKEKSETKYPMPRTYSTINWVVDSIDADLYMKAYRDCLDEDDTYNLPAKELKEYYEGERIYKYYPVELPLKMDGHDVYSYRKEDQWEKIGRVKRNADLNGKLVLNLYPNIYKRVREDGIEKDSGDSYFGVEMTRTE